MKEGVPLMNLVSDPCCLLGLIAAGGAAIAWLSASVWAGVRRKMRAREVHHERG
jgi:hypothetical protein